MFIGALLTIAKIWEQLKCPLINEWIKKKAVVDICNEILLNHKKS